MTGGRRLVDSFEILGDVGRGGMGRVYRARERATGAVRAVKVLDAPVDPDTFERFEREAQALARVGRGVVPVHATGVADGRPWFVMDLLPGGSLEARLRAAGRLPWREAAGIAAALARTLERCAALGLVHRDVKPANVLFAETGEPLLADFGCVRDLGRSRLTETGQVIGSPAYMAPEQLGGRPTGPAADVFALGAVLYESVTGSRPHDGRSLYEIAGAIAARRWPRPSKVSDCPDALDDLVARALAADPTRRPTAGELALALERLLSGARNPAPEARSRSRLLLVVALGLAALLVVAAGAVALRGRAVPGAGSAPPRAALDPAAPGSAAPGSAARTTPGPGPSRARTRLEAEEARFLEQIPRAQNPEILLGLLRDVERWRRANPEAAVHALVGAAAQWIDRFEGGELAADNYTHILLSWELMRTLVPERKPSPELVARALQFEPATIAAGFDATRVRALVVAAELLADIPPSDEQDREHRQELASVAAGNHTRVLNHRGADADLPLLRELARRLCAAAPGCARTHVAYARAIIRTSEPTDPDCAEAIRQYRRALELEAQLLPSERSEAHYRIALSLESTDPEGALAELARGHRDAGLFMVVAAAVLEARLLLAADPGDLQAVRGTFDRGIAAIEHADRAGEASDMDALRADLATIRALRQLAEPGRESELRARLRASE